jgi:hypothetical protein
LLEEIDDQILKDIGVQSAGHRMRIKKAIASISRLPQEPAEEDSRDKPSVTPL